MATKMSELQHPKVTLHGSTAKGRSTNLQYLQVRSAVPSCPVDQFIQQLSARLGGPLTCVDLKDLQSGSSIWQVESVKPVEPAWPFQGIIDGVHPVGGPNNDDFTP